MGRGFAREKRPRKATRKGNPGGSRMALRLPIRLRQATHASFASARLRVAIPDEK
jgi:hypothetical protein